MAILMTFFTIFWPFSANLTAFMVSQIFLVQDIRNHFFLLPQAYIHYEVARIGQNSSHDTLTIPLKSCVFSQIFDQTANLDKKMMEKNGFLTLVH